MSELEDKLNTLTPEELNALNTDPELLAEFKTKYGTDGHAKAQAVLTGTSDLLSKTGQATQNAFNQGGQNVAENLAQGTAIKPGMLGSNAPFPANLVPGLGMPSLQSAPGQNQVPPQIAAGIGTAIQMAPDIATSVVGPAMEPGAAAAGDLGQIGRVVGGPGRSEAGAAMGAAEEAAGAHPDIIPTLKDVTANLGLPRGTDVKQYLNALMERIKSGEPMSVESLSQNHKMISDLLSKEPGSVLKSLGAPSKLGSPTVAQAAKVDSALVNLLNSQAPGRAGAAANYAAAMARRNLYRGITGAAAAAGAGNVILDALKKAALKRG